MSDTRDWRTTFGFGVTTAWLVSVAAYIGFWAPTKVLGMDPHDLAESFAAVFGPLAFLWLVLGYFQQSEELRLQREELALQREEVHRLANETTRQATAVEANEQHARRDTFLRLKELIDHELDGACMRILRSYLNDEYFTRICARFSQGERDIFAREMINWMADKDYKVVIVNEQATSIDMYCILFDYLVSESKKLDDFSVIEDAIMRSAAFDLRQIFLESKSLLA